MFQSLIKLSRACIILAIYFGLTAEIHSLDSLFFRAGYGGTWFFSKSTYASNVYPIGVIDTVAFGADLKFTNNHGISTSYTQNGIFVTNSFTMIDTSYRYFPFDWYNQIFIGGGLSYLNFGFADPRSAQKMGINLSYGFYFQFPNNIYLTAEFKNIFHPDADWSSEALIIQHTCSITGSVAYRLMLSNSEHPQK